MKKGDKVWVPKRGSESYGELESWEDRPDGKREFVIKLDRGGRTTALGDDIEVIG